ncbi:hypothetical protein L8S13_06395 [Vibrio lentus]|uniref:hypothetical protein n=1 Tax=Vibrio lentus TaxID=136468 RepID=UPI00246908E0|nr:hypothetical protein [Vibrio lentus]MDH5925910.1 hypothetical protein [Vibrio lentus]
MNKNTLFSTIIVLLLAGCNSSDNTVTGGETSPGNPGLPTFPPGEGDEGNGNDQTNPDGDVDLKDKLILEAAQRWGTTYDEMYQACQLWECNLGGVQDRLIFTIDRETQLSEGSMKVTFTLTENRTDFWPKYTFYSDLIKHSNVQIEHVESSFHYAVSDETQSSSSTLKGWKTGFDEWSTQDPRECTNNFCSDIKTSWLENAQMSQAMAVYREDDIVFATQRGYVTGEELQVLFPMFDATFPGHY